MPAAHRLRRALQGSFGSCDAHRRTRWSSTAPLVLGGLAVGFGFKAGLFNIGAQGQFLMGALGRGRRSAWRSPTQPASIAIPVAVVGGMLGGALWGFIPGVLKAVSGAHEVVTTIMLNYIAVSVLARAGERTAARSPRLAVAGHRRRRQRGTARSSSAATATSASSSPSSRSCWSGGCCTGRRSASRSATVGANPDAARYAGMRPQLADRR